jgi:hypothetical protein
MSSSESGTANGRVDSVPGGADATVGALTVGQRVDRVNDTAQEAWSRTRETVNDLKDRLDIDGRVARNPYGMMAAALGVGYVLGGGFFSPLTARIVGLGVRMGLRLAAIPFLENELRELTESVVNGSQEREGDEEGEGNGARKRSHHSRGTTKGR